MTRIFSKLISPLDRCRSVTDEYRLKVYVRVVRLLIEDGDTVQAQSYLSRAQNLIRNTNDQETIRRWLYYYFRDL